MFCELLFSRNIIIFYYLSIPPFALRVLSDFDFYIFYEVKIQACKIKERLSLRS